MKRAFKIILNQAWLAYLIAALLLIALGDRSRAYFSRISMLQLFSEYPIQFVYDQKPYDKTSFRHAIRYYYALNKKFPQVVDIYEILGICYAEIGKFEKAGRYLQQAYQLNDKLFWNDFNIGVLEYRMKHFSQAEQIFQRISFLGPNDIGVFPFDNVMLRSFSASVQKSLVNSSIIFNREIIFKARVMLLQCLWEQEKASSIIHLANRFFQESDNARERFMFSIWEARSIAKLSSPQASLYYLQTMQNQYSYIPDFSSFQVNAAAHMQSAQEMDDFFQGMLPLFEQFVIHPWRHAIMVGREFFLGRASAISKK